jgi:FSR family fosmidomycin resistance protein-like MFS transporter
VTSQPPRSSGAAAAPQTAIGILGAISLCHCLNDLMQSVVPAVYPILKASYALDFGQIGLITFANQATASLLQPIVGRFTDSKPKPYSLAVGMSFTLVGLLLLSLAPSFGSVLAAVACVGIGSSIFHPESSRVARMASGGRHGFAQSFFQVGGNAGSALGPLLAAFIVLPRGQGSIAWFSLTALVGIVILARVGAWYKHHLPSHVAADEEGRSGVHGADREVWWSLAILVALVFSKNVYLASLTSYYTFYLIHKFGLSVQSAATAPVRASGGRRGRHVHRRPGRRSHRRKYVIWVSILGRAAVHAAPALRQPARDRSAQRHHRFGAGVGVLGYRGLCAGARARPRRHHFGHLLRVCVWRRRDRGGACSASWPM